MKRKCRCEVRVGAFAGFVSVADLEDLIKAKDYQIGQDGNARGALGNEPDPGWDTEWANLISRYGTTRDRIQPLIDATPDAVIEQTPAGWAWDALIASIRHDPTGPVVKGDLADLESRLLAVMKVDYSKMPQPRADADLRIFQAADKVTRGIEKGVRITTGTIIPIALGVLVLVALAKR